MRGSLPINDVPESMPLLLLLILAPAAGLATGLLAWRFPRTVASPPTAVESARKIGETIGRHRSLRRVLRARLDPAAATGLALTLAMIVVIGGGVVFGLLAYLVRSNAHLRGIDNGVAKWGNAHASAFSTDGLNVVTQLGGIYLVVTLCFVLVVSQTIAERSAWVIAFVVAVMGGEELLTLTVKDLAHRVRPAFNPAAATLGPSFPSGHSATAAAFYACAAFLIARRHRRPTQAALTGLAVGLAVAVAASPRAPRRALADGRHRRPRPRLDMVLGVRDRLRRPAAALRRGRRNGSPGHRSAAAPVATRARVSTKLVGAGSGHDANPPSSPARTRQPTSARRRRRELGAEPAGEV